MDHGPLGMTGQHRQVTSGQYRQVTSLVSLMTKNFPLKGLVCYFQGHKHFPWWNHCDISDKLTADIFFSLFSFSIFFFFYSFKLIMVCESEETSFIVLSF